MLAREAGIEPGECSEGRGGGVLLRLVGEFDAGLTRIGVDAQSEVFEGQRAEIDASVDERLGRVRLRIDDEIGLRAQAKVGLDGSGKPGDRLAQLGREILEAHDAGLADARGHLAARERLLECA